MPEKDARRDKHRKEKQRGRTQKKQKKWALFKTSFLSGRRTNQPARYRSAAANGGPGLLGAMLPTVQASFISTMGRGANVLGGLIHK